MTRASLPLLAVGLIASLSSPARAGEAVLPDVTLTGTDHQSYRVRELAAKAPATAVFFFSSTCPCQDAHDGRLVSFYEEFKAQGLQLLVVDSNYSAKLEADAAEVQSRKYPFPILMDQGGILMNALGAKYATYAVLLDPAGKVRYRGGFDSDRHPLTDHAKPFLADAVKSLLTGRDPNPAETKAMGCALERW